MKHCPCPRFDIHKYDEVFEVRGYTFGVQYEPDPDHEAPWDNDCWAEGLVSDWTRRDKLPGERILARDRQSRRYYDFQAAVRKARTEQWGVEDGRQPGETARAYAARAADWQYEFYRRWCNDEWHYVGVIVTLLELDEDDEPAGETDDRESVWGIESEAREYLKETARELAGEILARVEVADPDIARSEN